MPCRHLNAPTEPWALHATRNVTTLEKVLSPHVEVTKNSIWSLTHWLLRMPRIQCPVHWHDLHFSTASTFRIPLCSDDLGDESGSRRTSEDTHTRSLSIATTRLSDKASFPSQTPRTHLSIINPPSGLRSILYLTYLQKPTIAPCYFFR